MKKSEDIVRDSDKPGDLAKYNGSEENKKHKFVNPIATKK